MAEALRRYGTAALMVHKTNHTAIGLYTSLGLRYRAVHSARHR